ncbi:MAG: epoxyqueuosine reductase QueH [bacterium]
MHICCAPDAVAAIPELMRTFEVAGYFFNPNITTSAEYNLRYEEEERLAKLQGYGLLDAEYDSSKWLEMIKGLENEPEGGKRCQICFKYRFDETAKKAASQGYEYFGTVLTNSPHKDNEQINSIGREVAALNNLNYFRSNFKKHGGFHKSVLMSKELKLHRQNYCGCEFSKRK